MQSLAVTAIVGFLLAGCLTVSTRNHQRAEKTRRPAFEMNATSFFVFMRDFREQAEMYARDNIEYAELIDRPWGEIDWAAVDDAIEELNEETRLFRNADDVLIEMLAALWNSSGAHVQEHLGACGTLTQFVLDVQAGTKDYNTTEALHLYANDLRCNVNLMKTVFWFNKSMEFHNDVDMLKAIIHTLTDLTRLNWVEMNMEWAAYMAFDVLPAEKEFYGKKRVLNADPWADDDDDLWDMDSAWDGNRRGMNSEWDADKRGMDSTWNVDKRRMDSLWDADKRGMDSDWDVDRNMDSDWDVDKRGMDSDWDADKRGVDEDGLDMEAELRAIHSEHQNDGNSQRSREMDDDEWDMDVTDEDWGHNQRDIDRELSDWGTGKRNMKAEHGNVDDTSDEEDIEQLRLALRRLLKNKISRSRRSLYSAQHRYQSPRRK